MKIEKTQRCPDCGAIASHIHINGTDHWHCDVCLWEDTYCGEQILPNAETLVPQGEEFSDTLIYIDNQ